VSRPKARGRSMMTAIASRICASIRADVSELANHPCRRDGADVLALRR
jgi:hypothetical protein